MKSYSKTKYSVKKEKTRNTLVNTKHLLHTPEGNFVIYRVNANLSSNSGVLRNGCPIHCINTLPYYRSTFKSSPATWNSSPNSIKNCSSLHSFKRHLMSHLIAQLT